jgi:hypothetical protein
MMAIPGIRLRMEHDGAMKHIFERDYDTTQAGDGVSSNF